MEAFTNIANVVAYLSGMFSTIDLPKIMIMRLAAVPTRTRPKTKRATVPPIEIRAPTMAKK